MYTVIHVDPNGSEDKIGEFKTEEEARSSATEYFREYCYLDEYLENCISAFGMKSSDSVGNLLSILSSVFRKSDKDGEKYLTEAMKYCDETNNSSRDIVVIFTPEGFKVTYWAELVFNHERGFFYCVNWTE